MARPRVPTALKLARGTFRKDRHGDHTLEPRGTVLKTIPKAPKSLGKHGKAKWKETGERLQSLGLLEDRFLEALEMYCSAWDRLAHYEDVLAKTDEFYAMPKTGHVCRHPAAIGAKQARADIHRYQNEFGLTASSSNGIKFTAPNKRGMPNRANDVR